MSRAKFEIDDVVMLKLPGAEEAGMVTAIITERQSTKYRVYWLSGTTEEFAEALLKDYEKPKDEDDD